MFQFLQVEETAMIGDEISERQIVACIPIPGLNEWAKNTSSNESNIELYVLIFISIMNNFVIIKYTGLF